MDDRINKLDLGEMALLLVVGGLVMVGLGLAMIAIAYISCSISFEQCEAPGFLEFMGQYLRG